MLVKFFSRFIRGRPKAGAPANDGKLSPALSPKTAFGVGALIDRRYRLEAEIGRGGMGIVYRGLDLTNQRPVAVKIINLDLANALSQQQFARETQIMLGLHHPHIVAVYAAGQVETGSRQPAPYIVMEWVEGTNLGSLCGFTFARIIDLGQQMCEALAYAHNQGIVHRDLKPENVLLEKHGFRYSVKLADFGLARPLDSPAQAAESSLAGTVFYLAPEVIAGQPCSPGSDLYALGVILYEMLTGRLPFSDFFDDQAILAQHLEEPVAPPSHSRAGIPPELEGVVLRLLAKDPQERFASAADVCAALEHIHLGPTSSALRTNLPQSGQGSTALAAEAAQVGRLLENSRLVTVQAETPALALAAGVLLLDSFRDGVWQVELGALDEPARVLSQVAAVLGVHANPQRSLTVSLVECLHEKNVLLILNIGGQLRGACAQLADTLIAACPEVFLLVASRQPLNAACEKVYISPNLAQ